MTLKITYSAPVYEFIKGELVLNFDPDEKPSEAADAVANHLTQKGYMCDGETIKSAVSQGFGHITVDEKGQ